MHLQQKALKLQFFLKVMIAVLVFFLCRNSCFCVIYTPVFFYLWHNVFFSYYVLNVVLYCLRDNPDETAMFNLNQSSPILGGNMCMW